MERSRRIKRDLKAFGTLRDLHREVQALVGEGVRGTSYGAVRAIVEGDVDHPRPNVVRAIAETLGVRFEYLMDLEGARTPREADYREAVQEREEAPFFERIEAAIPELANLDSSVSEALYVNVERWALALDRADFDVGEEEVMAYALAAWEWIQEPFRAWSRLTGERTYVFPNEGSDYAMSALHTLNLSLSLVSGPAAAPAPEEEESDGEA